VVAADESLKTHDAKSLDVVDWLIIDLEFVTHQGGAHIEFELPSRLGAGIHSGLKEPVGAAAFLLRPVKRYLRIF
jgi:hypothetical protein